MVRSSLYRYPHSQSTSRTKTKQDATHISATFNALCILYGALAFHSQDLSVVVPDLLLVHDIVRRGLGIIQRIASIGGLKAQQSKRFLQKLIRATLRRYEKVCLTSP